MCLTAFVGSCKSHVAHNFRPRSNQALIDPHVEPVWQLIQSSHGLRAVGNPPPSCPFPQNLVELKVTLAPLIIEFLLSPRIFGPSYGPGAKGWQTLFHIWGMTDIKECETLATGHHYHFFFAASPCQKPFGFTWLLFTTYTKCIWSSELYRLDNPESFVVVRASWNQIRCI